MTASNNGHMTQSSQAIDDVQAHSSHAQGSKDEAVPAQQTRPRTLHKPYGENSSAEVGFVSLVGAGPGDPDLLTLKGKAAIEQADVIIYDRLIAPELLAHARPACQRIYVGKQPGKHSLKQEEINALLVEKALEGHYVVRLKGGDPFVFGRGGEEALALKAQGIDFEVVPGVSSAIAVPAYAGIPVTHRGHSSLFTVITGHEDPQKEETSLDWQHISATEGTLIFLMGKSNLEHIAERLLHFGKDPDTPVALIEKGAGPAQHTVCSTLRSVVSEAQQARLDNPLIIVVGEVVALREELAWFERKPLFGQRILVTRAKKQASRLSHALRDLGAQIEEMPVIAIQPPTHPEQLTRAVQNAQAFTWLIFTSVNGVEAFFAELFSQGLDVRHLAGVKLVAIGSATQAALEGNGLRNITVPGAYYAEGILKEMRTQVGPDDRILLVRAEEARAVLPQELQATGAKLTEVAAYKTVAPPADETTLAKLKAGGFDAVSFTSSSTVHNLITMLGGDSTPLQKIKRYSIGPITSETLRAYGLEPSLQAHRYCIEGLIETLVSNVKHQEEHHD